MSSEDENTAKSNVQKQVSDLAETAVNYPHMQAPASFNLEAVKRQVQELLKEHEGQ